MSCLYSPFLRYSCKIVMLNYRYAIYVSHKNEVNAFATNNYANKVLSIPLNSIKILSKLNILNCLSMERRVGHQLSLHG